MHNQQVNTSGQQTMADNVTFGDLMRQLMSERDVSLRRLAKIVNYDVGYLSKVMNGHKPPSPELATRLDDSLGADGELSALAPGLRTTEPITLGWPLNVEDTCHATSRLLGCIPSARDMESGTSNAVGAVTLRWLVASPDAAVQRGKGTRRINEGDVQRLHAVRHQLKILDDAHGGGTAFPMALAYLRAEVKPLLSGHYDEATGRLLLEAAAELILDAGWMIYDAGTDQYLARSYLVHALRLAHAAGNRLLGARILCALSHQALHLKERQLALDLARAARSGTAKIATPKMIAMMAAMEACAQAAIGDASSCATALADAETALSRTDAGDQTPVWLDFDEGGMWGHAARAYRDLAEAHSGRTKAGMAKAALSYAAQSIALCRPDHSRTRAQRNTILASTHLQLGDIDQASAVGSQILDDAWNVRSGHVQADVTSLVNVIAANKSTTRGDFLDRARELLAAHDRQTGMRA